MAIYSRFGEVVSVLRYATKADVLKMDPPFDAVAKKSLANQSWVVLRFEDGSNLISHLAYLRADDGLREIIDAVEATEAPGADAENDGCGNELPTGQWA